MQIEVYNGTRQRVPQLLLKRAGDVVGKKMRAGGCDISVAFIGERRMRTLNRIYRGKDAVTDVLSFVEAGERRRAGEVVLCYQQIKRQAKRQGTSVQTELVFIFVHGLLHVLGYDDATTAGWREMERLGTALCKSIV